ncbi:MAG: heparinase II/III family protein [Clostridiaceae bacterium]|nr:heparinase II/III family protein [Clostridiaceae bacterium]
MYNNFLPAIPHNSRNERIMGAVESAAAVYQDQEIKELPFSKYRIYFETGSRVEYEACYIEHRRRLNVYTAMALYSEDDCWINGLEDIIWAVCNEFTWAFPAHMKDEKNLHECSITIDLFSAETGLALSETCYLLSARLSTAVRERVKNEVWRRLITPYTENNITFHKDNWSAVCAGCIGMAVMYLGAREEFALIEDKIMGSMEDFIGSYQEDGCCLEGALYWGYGFGYFCYFAEMLREYTGGKTDLFKRKKVKQIALFRQKVYLEKNVVVPFADAPHNYSPHIGLMHFLAKEYEEVNVPDERYAAVFDEDIRHRYADFIRDFYWYDPKLKKNEKDGGVSIFLQSQWHIKKMKDYSFAAKGGRNNEPHNHNDIGSFIIYSGGRFILDDLGWPEYDGDYFGEKRYDNLCASSAGHSVPVLGGAFQERGSGHKSVLLNACSDEFRLDITRAYQEGRCKSLIRSFVLENQGIRLSDTICGMKGELRERFVTRIPPQKTEYGVKIDNWAISGAERDGSVEIKECSFEPRLSICKMDMKPVETAYLIDFIYQADGRDRVFDFIIKKVD